MILTQSMLDVNTIELREARLCCMHFMPALALLQSRNPPAIPCSFLLDDVSFVNEYVAAIRNERFSRLPWRDGYAKLFWNRYIPDTTPGGLRRALVPIEFDFGSVVASLALSDGKVDARAFLYPWGMGILIDITFKLTLALDLAVSRLIEIRNHSNIAWKMGSDAGTASPAVLASEIRRHLAPVIYGADVEMENAGEQFSVATVIDASDQTVTDPIPENGPVHYALEGLTGWKPKWKIIQPETNALVTCRIPGASAPLGHILYGKSRSRAVWFPANFRSVADYPDTLSCYHQNLSTASLHTEALCALAQDAAAQLATRGSLADFSVTYRNCAQLAAGLLGRLHGRKSDESMGMKPPTYRSGSVRAQILNYRDDVNRVRLALLAGGTTLDA
ncbi:MAG: hypothetical protein ACRD3N_12025 [Terracidiphilus sp.]